jgi:valyl-tRNA synthetase
MGMMAGRSPGFSAAYSPGKLDAGRNFCNKLWNVARFIEDTIGDSYNSRHKATPKTPADHWILAKLALATDKIALDLDNYRFSDAYDTLYHTVWDDFADWYIESSKTAANHAVLAYCLETILKLAHPFAPFVTETIWQTLKWEKGLLISTTWPETLGSDSQQTATFEALQSLITEARAIMRSLNVSKTNLYHTSSPLLTEHKSLIMRLAKLKDIKEVSSGKGLHLTKTTENCWLDIDHQTARLYVTKLEEKQTAEALSVQRLKARLSNESYVKNAPKKLVSETKNQLKESEQRLHQITTELDRFNAVTKEL